MLYGRAFLGEPIQVPGRLYGITLAHDVVAVGDRPGLMPADQAVFLSNPHTHVFTPSTVQDAAGHVYHDVREWSRPQLPYVTM